MPRAMLLFAHPDDEVVALGARLGRLGNAWFVHVTDGAPRNEADSRAHGFATLADYRRVRKEELGRALALAGIADARCVRLEIPDQEASVQLAALTRWVEKLLKEAGPEVLFTHPYEGGHPDHDACAFAAHHAIARAKLRGEAVPLIIEGAFYHALGANGTFLPCTDSVEEVLHKLTPEERARKQALLACFTSQQEMLAGFPVGWERFRVAPQYEFRQPAHVPPVLYDRYPWGITSARFSELAAEAKEALDGDWR